MTTDVSSRQRTPRFRRVPKREGFEPTARDIEILRAVYRYRFLRSTHIADLDGGSAQKILRRLNTLYHHGFLDRLAVRNEPMIYAMSRQGARTLEVIDATPIGGLDWTYKNNKSSTIYREHTLMTADVMVAFECACHACPRVRLIDQEGVLATAPEATRNRREPFRWRTDVTSPDYRRHRFGLYPDRVFSLVLDEQKRSNFFLEADRGSMDVAPKNPWRNIERKTSIWKKLLLYHTGWSAKRHEAQFGWRNFRVLTVTTSRQRVDNMVAAAQEVTGGRTPGLFLFGEIDGLLASDPLSYEWHDGQGGPVKLIE